MSNVSTETTAPTLGNYPVSCGQYPGAVGAGATVSLQCTNENDWPARYLFVQFPMVDLMNFCELDVCAKGSHYLTQNIIFNFVHVRHTIIVIIGGLGLVFSIFFVARFSPASHTSGSNSGLLYIDLSPLQTVLNWDFLHLYMLFCYIYECSQSTYTIPFWLMHINKTSITQMIFNSLPF